MKLAADQFKNCMAEAGFKGNNSMPQYLWDKIICPCPWYLLLPYMLYIIPIETKPGGFCGSMLLLRNEINYMIKPQIQIYFNYVLISILETFYETEIYWIYTRELGCNMSVSQTWISDYTVRHLVVHKEYSTATMDWFSKAEYGLEIYNIKAVPYIYTGKFNIWWGLPQ